MKVYMWSKLCAVCLQSAVYRNGFYSALGILYTLKH